MVTDVVYECIILTRPVCKQFVDVPPNLFLIWVFGFPKYTHTPITWFVL